MSGQDATITIASGAFNCVSRRMDQRYPPPTPINNLHMPSHVSPSYTPTVASTPLTAPTYKPMHYNPVVQTNIGKPFDNGLFK